MEMPIAKILSVSANRATVEVEPAAICARCAAGKGCGAGLFGAGRQSGQMEVDVVGSLALHAGERVYLNLEPANIVKASLVSYGLPLLGLILTPGLAWALQGPMNDLVAAAYAAGGLLAGVVAGRWYLSQQECLRNFVPTIRRRVVDAAVPVP